MIDRTVPPAFKNSLTFTLPAPQKLTGSNGVDVVYLPSATDEVAKIEILFPAGRLQESKLGVANLTIGQLDKGLAGRTSAVIAETFDFYGAHVEASAGFDYASFVLFSLSKNLPHVLPLFLELVTSPIFPEQELELSRKQMAEQLKVNLLKNSFVGNQHTRRQLFGNHPYGLAITLEALQSVGHTDVVSFFKQQYSPFKIFATGALAPTDLTQLEQFAKRATQVPKTPGSKPEMPFRAIQQRIEGPSKEQASIQFARPAIARTHPHHSALRLSNHLLGGFFGSRLMKNVREEKGLTYGIYSSLSHLAHASMLLIGAEVNQEKVDEAITEIKKEMEALRHVDSDELLLAKNHFIGSMQNDLTTIFAVAEKIKTLELHSLPLDYYQSQIRDIHTLTPHALAAIAEAYFNPAGFGMVAVG